MVDLAEKELFTARAIFHAKAVQALVVSSDTIAVAFALAGQMLGHPQLAAVCLADCAFKPKQCRPFPVQSLQFNCIACLVHRDLFGIHKRLNGIDRARRVFNRGYPDLCALFGSGISF